MTIVKRLDHLRISDLEERLTDALNANSCLHDKIAVVRVRNRALHDMKEKLTVELNDSKVRIENLLDENTFLYKILDKSRDVNTALRKGKKNYDAQVKKLNKNLGTVRGSNEVARTHINLLDSERKRLLTQLKQVRINYSLDLKVAKEALAKLEAECPTDLRDQVATLEAALAGTRARNSLIQSKKAQLVEELVLVRQERDVSNTRYYDLRDELKEVLKDE